MTPLRNDVRKCLCRERAFKKYNLESPSFEISRDIFPFITLYRQVIVRDMNKYFFNAQ